ncbi:MAG: hypothetical protein JNM07_11080 [Phycisphaerae bacterium]|nr:hypothetical protein [Phycisphaerae bacterium]
MPAIALAWTVAAAALSPPPDLPGPFHVGHRALVVVDVSRGRSIPVDAWYPVDAADAQGARASYTDAAFGPEAAFESAVAYADVVASAAGPFPLVVFSHGSPNPGYPCAVLFYAATLEHLASHGFVIFAPTHPGDSAPDLYAGTLMAIHDALRARPRDVSFVIDRALTMNADPQAPFFERIDPARIGVSGHSFGGFTSLAVASGYEDYAADSRVRAVLPCGPSSDLLEARKLSSLTVPTLLLDGLGALAVQGRTWSLLQADPGHLALVRDANHFSFLASFCSFYETLESRGGPQWLLDDLAGQRDAVCLGAGVIPIEQCTRLTNLYTTAFFKRHLLGDTSYDIFLTQAYAAANEPSVVYATRAQPDLNGNGVPDPADIASGSSPDADQDGVPDECRAEVLFVNAAATGANTGLAWTDAFRDLQDALRVAESSPLHAASEIRVAGGVYRPDQGTLDRDRSFFVPARVAVLGGYVGDEAHPDERDPVAHPTVLTGDLLGDDGPAFARRSDNARHVVRAQALDGGTVLDGFVIRAGESDGGDGQPDGGGLLVRFGAHATITRCTIEDCRAAGRGGGVFTGYWSSPMLDRIVVRGNRGLDGGGMVLQDFDSHARVTNGLFTDNAAAGAAPDGAGGGVLTSWSAEPEFLNCAFHDNHASVVGGAAAASLLGAPRFINTIMWGNDAPLGPQIGAAHDPSFDAPVTFSARHAILEGGPGAVFIEPGDALVLGPNVLTTDPRWADAAGSDFTLQPGSPAIDAGDSLALPSGLTLDLAGSPRRADDPDVADTGTGWPPIDIGPLELASASGCPADFNGDTSVDDFDYFDFLNAFSLSQAEGDINGDTSVDDFDYFDFLSAFFGGC